MKKDQCNCVKFCRNINKTFDEKFQTESIGFYFDGTSFAHKHNPSDEVRSSLIIAWKKRSEELDLNCTAKGRYFTSGDRVAHFVVATAYNEGIILWEQCCGKKNGDRFAQFVRDHFNETFKETANAEGKHFLQDENPNQNRKKAKLAFHLMLMP